MPKVALNPRFGAFLLFRAGDAAMATFINHAPEVQGLQLSMLRALEQIDCALDTGDRRAFRVWCGRLASLAARIERLLLKIATAEA